MPLTSQITSLATAIATEINKLRAGLGSLITAPFTSVGTLTVKVGAGRFPVKGGTFAIANVAAMVGTAPTGASIMVDVNKNGTTIYGTQANRPTIAIGATSATVGANSVTSVTDGDYLTVDIEQVGSTVAGSDLVVVVSLRKTA